MSFFSDASLVYVPSGVKNGKTYSIKPTDGSGDLTFSRASSATRVNSSGLVEKVRTNLILQSQTFDDASWGKDTTTVTANAEVAPDGTLTADTMTISTDASRVTQAPTIGAGSFTASVYVKIISQTTAGNVRFLGVVDGSVVNVNFTPTNQWARYTATFTASTSITSFQLRGATGGFVGTIAIWGFQLETGDIATDYIATTSAAVSVGPVSGLPRLDYSGGATCPSLLLEPQRTNLALYSEQFDNWLKFNSSVSSNVIASPSGYVDADKIVEDGSLSYHDIDQVQTYTATAYTISVFAKSAGRNHIFLQHFDGTTFFTSGTFNLSNGTVSGSGSIEDYGGGWYRCSFTATTASGTGKAYINLSNGTSGNYQGDGTSGVYVWGAQLEAGAYATSYIPTLSTAVTRVADAAGKTGISSLIGQTAGTMFVEFDFQKDIDSAYRISLSDGTTSNRIQLGTFGNEVQVYVQTGGVTQVFALGGTITTGTHKMALAYASNDYVAYLDGSAVITDTSASVPACSKLGFEIPDGTGLFEHPVKQTLLFKTRLSNADLATLTTL